MVVMLETVGCEPILKMATYKSQVAILQNKKEKDARNQEILNAIESSALVSFIDIDGKIIHK